MRIHTALDNESFGPLVATPKLRADVYMERWYEYGSRTHARAYDVILRGLRSITRDGEKRRRPNSGTSRNHYMTGQWAATYDEWGWFLAALFELDPLARCGSYNGVADFHEKTNNKFRDRSEVLAEVIDDLTGVCVFQFCDGPDEPFVSMQTCRVCASVQTLRTLIS